MQFEIDNLLKQESLVLQELKIEPYSHRQQKYLSTHEATVTSVSIRWSV